LAVRHGYASAALGHHCCYFLGSANGLKSGKIGFLLFCSLQHFFNGQVSPAEIFFKEKLYQQQARLIFCPLCVQYYLEMAVGNYHATKSTGEPTKHAKDD
jgi:hypothetical protein